MRRYKYLGFAAFISMLLYCVFPVLAVAEDQQMITVSTVKATYDVTKDPVSIDPGLTVSEAVYGQYLQVAITSNGSGFLSYDPNLVKQGVEINPPFDELHPPIVEMQSPFDEGHYQLVFIGDMDSTSWEDLLRSVKFSLGTEYVPVTGDTRIITFTASIYLAETESYVSAGRGSKTIKIISKQPPVYEPPVYEPPVYEPPVYEPPVYEPPTEEPPVQEQPKQGPQPVHNPEPPAQQPPVQQSGEHKPATKVAEDLEKFGVKDIKADHFAAGSISVLIEAGLMSPDANGNFNADSQLKTAEGIAVFAKVLGIASKTDTPEQALAKAQQAGIARQGLDSNTALRRSEVAILIARALGVTPKIITGPENYPFADYATTSPEDRGFLAALYELGVFKGYEDKTFRPDGVLTRAEIAILVDRILGSAR